MVEAVRVRAGDAVERLGIELPVVPTEIPTIHFREALAIAGASWRR
jgi:nondiscriminating aspartyl-tRNA synthetase